MIELNITREEAGRLASYARERRRKAKRGLDKFADNFDPEKGQGLQAAYEAASALERKLMEKIREHDEANPR